MWECHLVMVTDCSRVFQWLYVCVCVCLQLLWSRYCRRHRDDHADGVLPARAAPSGNEPQTPGVHGQQTAQTEALQVKLGY